MKEARTSRVLRATIEYDGARYRGWQSQMNARTVQGALYGAVKPVLGEGTRIFGSGRTDAGVHALGQVASLSLTRSVPVGELPRLRRAINDGLPPDVHVLALEPAPPGFHARHDAALRIYRYRLSRRRTAFGKPWVWWVKDPLDAAPMKKAAALLAGRHDFASFCENAPGHDSTLVEVAWAKVETPDSVPDLILFRIAASHFLWKMVRRLVGTLVEVGAGRMNVQKVASFLEAKSTEPARLTAPPSGLFLETVVYEGDPPPPEIDPLRPGW